MHPPSRGWSVFLWITAALATASPPNRSFAASAAAPTVFLDHLTVAVNDLDRARSRFESMGFTLKPGRPHSNSIRNVHAKFGDGTEIELITAAEPRDSLARDSLALMAQGDGGAFVALRSPAVDEVARRYKANGLSGRISHDGGDRWIAQPRGTALRFLWVQEIARPTIDPARFVTHANGAARLSAVWIDSSLAKALEPLRRAHGAPAVERPWPRGRSREIRLSGGALYCVAGRAARPSRPILGATVEVRDIAAVESLLRTAGIRGEHRRDERGATVLIAPDAANGIWLEFLQPD
jgi:hypothetical protein